MKKRKKIRNIILVSFLLFFVIGFGYFAIREFSIKSFLHHDNSLFEKEKYKEAYGGDYADIFFQKTTSLIQNSSRKDFYYLEGGNSLRLLHYCDSVFYLEITPNDYESDKNTLMNSYPLLDKDIFDESNNLVVGKGYSKDNYNFFTVDISIFNMPFNMDYPSEFGMVGYNDSKNIICIVYFYSPSLDYVENMEKFMKTNLFFIF